MTQYIDKDALIKKLEKEIKCIYAGREYVGISFSEENIVRGIQMAEDIINTFEMKEVDLEKESELIANGIMISVQSNKYGTNIYNTERNDFNHSHLQMAARKGIELGLKATQKGE